MTPFHSYSHGKAMVQVAKTVAIEAHILELGRAASHGVAKVAVSLMKPNVPIKSNCSKT